MSNYNSLKTTIDANIKQNGNQEITGQILNSVLNAMVTTLGAGYQFAGVATIDTNPGTPDAKVFYIANGKGTYEKFGGLEVTEDDVVVLYWDSSWHKQATGIASQGKLSELEGKIAHGNKKGVPIEFVQNGYLYETGEIATSSSSKVTGFIEIDRRNNYYLSNIINGSYDNGVCYYADADETTFIGRQFNKNDVGEGEVAFYGKLNIPATAKYIRIGTRSINNPNVVAFIIEEAEVSASVSSVNEIREASYNQENILNALYPFITNVNAENILDKNKVGDYDYAYINSSLKINKNINNALCSIIVKIDDYDGVNKTYIYKYFGEKSAADMGVSGFLLFLANEIVDGESVIDTFSNTSEMRGYSINTDKSSAYLYIEFIQSAYDYDNAMSVINYILDNLVVIKQEGTTIAYPTEYIPHTDKKIDFSIGPVPADLTADDSVSGVVSLGMVDKNGNLVGNGVTFNVGQGGGGELAADQLNVITSLTYHLQPSVLTSQSAILGTGWAGSLESGYTHTAGNTSPLEFPLSGMSAKARLLITFDVQGLSESNDVYISAGDSVLIKSYNGSTEIVAGLIYDGGNLKVTPTSDFAGTITNLKCRKLDDNGSETYTTQVDNVYCQRNSLVAGYWNVFIGSKTGTASKLQDSTRNIAIGVYALDEMSVGNRNVAIGTFAMPFVTEGENNIAIGSDSIYPVTKAKDSVSIGKGTMGGKSVEGCVALGAGAMGVWDDTIERFGCTSIGTNSAPAIVTGNTHVGYRAGVNTNGAYNTSIGYNSLGIGTRSSVDIVGTNITCVGHDASVANNETAKAANNSTALGYGATITKSNQVVIGNNAVDEVVIGGKKIIFNENGSVTWTTL